MYLQINSVQRFLRTISFFITLIFLSLITIVPIFSGIVNQSPGAIALGFLFGILNLWVAGIVSGMFYVLPEWEKLVLLRLGKFAAVKGPGFFIIPPFIYSVASIVDTRITTKKVEATATLTKDNVPTTVTAAIEFRVEDPKKAVISVKDYLSSVIWLSTEALKNTIGSMDLKELLSNRDVVAENLKNQIDTVAQEYGIDVRAVRITDIDTPQSLVEELAVIARARRAAKAKQIQAEAEVLVAKKVAEASEILDKQEGGFRLREIQNLSEISKEESSMIIVYPLDSSMGGNLASAAVSQYKRKPPAPKPAARKPAA